MGPWVSVIPSPFLEETKGSLWKESIQELSKEQGTKTQECLLAPLLLNIIQEVLAGTAGQEKNIKDIQIGEEEVKLSLFADSMVLYIAKPKESTKVY